MVTVRSDRERTSGIGIPGANPGICPKSLSPRLQLALRLLAKVTALSRQGDIELGSFVIQVDTRGGTPLYSWPMGWARKSALYLGAMAGACPTHSVGAKQISTWTSCGLRVD